MYLDAWTYAASLKPVLSNSPIGSALDKLIDNWTNAEFVKFVDELAELVNRYVVRVHI